jgi:hypothetical protein
MVKNKLNKKCLFRICTVDIILILIRERENEYECLCMRRNLVSHVSVTLVFNESHPTQPYSYYNSSFQMYSLLSGFYNYLTQKEEYYVLIIGLDNAGKTVSVKIYLFYR